MISKRVQVATAWEPGLGTGLDLHVACSGHDRISWNRAPSPISTADLHESQDPFSASKVGNPRFSGNVSSLYWERLQQGREGTTGK
jgi:hypothetical protein